MCGADRPCVRLPCRTAEPRREPLEDGSFRGDRAFNCGHLGAQAFGPSDGGEELAGECGQGIRVAAEANHPAEHFEEGAFTARGGSADRQRDNLEDGARRQPVAAWDFP